MVREFVRTHHPVIYRDALAIAQTHSGPVTIAFADRASATIYHGAHQLGPWSLIVYPHED
jgi:hypothetical protein